MSIVAISQTLGSLGDDIGRRLARVLSYDFADREILLQAAERFGEDPTGLRHATEDRPTLWERLAHTERLSRAYVMSVGGSGRRREAERRVAVSVRAVALVVALGVWPALAAAQIGSSRGPNPGMHGDRESLDHETELPRTMVEGWTRLSGWVRDLGK